MQPCFIPLVVIIGSVRCPQEIYLPLAEYIIKIKIIISVDIKLLK